MENLIRVVSVREKRVIEVKLDIGSGTKEDPAREVTRYWDLLGNYIGEQPEPEIHQGVLLEALAKKDLALADDISSSI